MQLNYKETEGMSLQWRQKPAPYNHKSCLGRSCGLSNLNVPGSKYPPYCCIKGYKSLAEDKCPLCSSWSSGVRGRAWIQVTANSALWGWSSSVRTFRSTAAQIVQLPAQECGFDCIQQDFAWSRFMNNVIYWTGKQGQDCHDKCTNCRELICALNFSPWGHVYLKKKKRNKKPERQFGVISTHRKYEQLGYKHSKKLGHCVMRFRFILL